MEERREIKSKEKSNGIYKQQYWTNALYHDFSFYFSVFSQSHLYAVSGISSFFQFLSTLLMVIEMFTGHFKYVAIDLLFISVFARLLALFLE